MLTSAIFRQFRGGNSRPLQNKGKIRSKEPCPGQVNPALAHKEAKLPDRALGGATGATASLPAKLVRLFAPQRHCSLHAHNPRNARAPTPLYALTPFTP